jgi:hypothetical protein
MTNDGVGNTSPSTKNTDTNVNAKCQSSKGEISGKPQKGALSEKL